MNELLELGCYFSVNSNMVVISDGLFGHSGGYIGSGTRSEIEYATATGKAVKYLES